MRNIELHSLIVVCEFFHYPSNIAFAPSIILCLNT